MLRKLISALFGISVIQNPDALKNEKTETVIQQEQIIDLKEEKINDIDLILVEQEMTTKTFEEQQSFSSSDQNCKKCPLHCSQKKKTEWHNFKSNHKDWLSDKMKYLKVEMVKIKSKVSHTFDEMKTKAKNFIDKKRGDFSQSESRNKFHSR